MRLINADELLDLYSGKRLDDTFVPVPVIRQNIKDMPTVQSKKGKWIKDRLVSTSGGSYGVYRCSLCSRAYQDVGYGFNYCPNCGAEMEEEDD